MIGWLGSIMLAFCGLPLAVQVVRQGSARDLSRGTLVLWTLGEIFTIVSVWKSAPSLTFLLFNYGMNLIFLSVIWFYIVFPRTRT